MQHPCHISAVRSPLLSGVLLSPSPASGTSLWKDEIPACSHCWGERCSRRLAPSPHTCAPKLPPVLFHQPGVVRGGSWEWGSELGWRQPRVVPSSVQTPLRLLLLLARAAKIIHLFPRVGPSPLSLPHASKVSRLPVKR